MFARFFYTVLVFGAQNIPVKSEKSLTFIIDRRLYNSQKYNGFTVHTNQGIIKFNRDKQEICVFGLTYTTTNYNVVATGGENMMVFTSRKIDRVKLVRKI